MKKYSSIEEAVNAVKKLADYWSDTITVTNFQTSKGFRGYFLDMTTDKVSFLFLKSLKDITDDSNPIITPIDEETVQIGTYVIINDSGE